jgi:serine/threonine protein kinase
MEVAMSTTVGTILGSYEITGLLGEGGMGRVFRARDNRLKRDVAIKILPDRFSHDPDRISRFQREAEALAALNHPNIGAIYDLQEANNSRFLILELVEGDTLAGVLEKRGALPVHEALNIAAQICEALEAAHEKGHHPPRSQAGQHKGVSRWESKGPGLRPGESSGKRSGGSGEFADIERGRDNPGCHSGNRRIYEPRAGPG